MFANSGGAPLNQDVLHEMLLYVGRKEQAAAARVARLWTLPAQQALYRSITFHTWNTTSQPSGQGLVQTLKDSSYLRALVRQICIHASKGEPYTFDWVDMFPPNSLRNVTYICWPREVFHPELLTKVSIRTVPHLTASGPADVEGLRACFQLPLMETLELDLSEWLVERYGNRLVDLSKLGLDAAKAPKLKHLYIHVHRVREAVVNCVLAVFAPQLRSLHIHFSPRTKVERLTSSEAKWASDFIRYVRRGRNLTQVVFSGLPAVKTAYLGQTETNHAQFGPLEFLDQILSPLGSTGPQRQQSVIEHLGCMEGLYTEKLFQTLPHNVKALEFYVDEETYAYEGALLDLLGRVKRDGLFLHRLRFFAPEERRALFGAIEAACGENEVGFEFVPVLPPLHNPPTRPAIVWD